MAREVRPARGRLRRRRDGADPRGHAERRAFEKRVGDPGKHAELGEQLLWFALPLLMLAVVLVVLDRYGTQGGLTTVVAVLAVIAAAAAGVQVFRVGDSGARAAWETR